MPLYENRKLISLYDALYRMKADNIPNHNFEFMISFSDVKRTIAFGKTWTKNCAEHMGKLWPVYFVHQEYCPTYSFPVENEDLFLAELFDDAKMKPYINEVQFQVWEEVK